MADNHHQILGNCASSRVTDEKQVMSEPRVHTLSHAGGLGGAGQEDGLSVRYSYDSYKDC